ncbi:MAG: LysM peptidoglycan-binding domain-containing protein [Gemmatimonadota bacterium]
MSTPKVTPARSISPALLPAVLVAASLLLAVPVGAQDTIPPPTQQREHVVRPGDTLWELARAYLRDPFLWPLLFDVNRGLLTDPDLILPQQRLLIPVTKPDERGPVGTPVGQLPVEVEPPPEPPAPPPADTVAAPQEEMTLPWAVRPGEYASAPWLADTAQLAWAGRIVRLADPSESEERLASTLHPFDQVLVGQLRAGSHVVGDTLLAVRLEGDVDGWGHKVFPMAVLIVDTVAGPVVRARVRHQYADARVGDLVLVDTPRPAMPRGQPRAIANGPTGAILDFARDRPLNSVLHHGFIDMGADRGVSLGDEFEAFAAGDGEVPPQPVAHLRVIRVERTSATVLVTGLTSTALRGGLPVRLIRRMQ